MPYSELHTRKKFKNTALFVVLVALVVLFFVLGVIKFQSIGS
jgi:hypothetical protein